MKRTNIKRAIISVGLVCFVFMMFILSRMDQRENFRLIEGKMHELSGPWTISSMGVIKDNVKLPYDLNLDVGVRYSSTTLIPLLAANQDTILLRSSMQDIWVYLDDVLIHEHVQPEPLIIHNPPTSLWVLVNLPENSVGKTLRIEYLSKVKAFSGVINEVHLDRKAMILHDIFVSQSFGFAVFLILLILGIVSIGTSFAYRNSQYLRLFYLGFMAISSGIWILTEARLLQYFVGNRFILGSMAYLMIPIIAFFFALYVRDTIMSQTKYKQHLKYLALLFIAIILINVLMQITGVGVYIELMQITLPIILISSIYTAYMIYLEITIHHNEEAKKFVKFTIILLVSLVLETGSFFYHAFSSISVFFRIGIVVFFGMLAVDTFMYIRSNMRIRDETLMLKKLAYKDFLTGGNNRTAYERDVQQHIDSKLKFRLILLDLNDLKYINDTYGHGQGDEAIRLVFKAMEKGFVSGHNYRIGGDEFAVLMDAGNYKEYLSSVQLFQRTLKESARDFVHPLKVAVGSDIYTSEKWEYFGKFYHHVDQKMYEHKLKIKSAS